MNHNKFEIGDKVEVHSVTGVDAWYNGKLGVVKMLPGWSRQMPFAYALLMQDGTMEPVIERFIRTFSVLPSSRGDADTKTTWEEFDTATGVRSTTFRDGFNPNRDY